MRRVFFFEAKDLIAAIREQIFDMMSSILVYFENSKLEVGGKILSHLALFKTKIAEQVPENLKRVHCLSALTSSMLKSIFYQQRIVKFCTKYAQAHRI